MEWCLQSRHPKRDCSVMPFAAWLQHCLRDQTGILGNRRCSARGLLWKSHILTLYENAQICMNQSITP
jgi:hypothetical protein